MKGPHLIHDKEWTLLLSLAEVHSIDTCDQLKLSFGKYMGPHYMSLMHRHYRVDKDSRNGDRVIGMHRDNGVTSGISPDEVLGPCAVIIGSSSTIVDVPIQQQKMEMGGQITAFDNI